MPDTQKPALSLLARIKREHHERPVAVTVAVLTGTAILSNYAYKLIQTVPGAVFSYTVLIAMLVPSAWWMFGAIRALYARSNKGAPLRPSMVYRAIASGIGPICLLLIILGNPQSPLISLQILNAALYQVAFALLGAYVILVSSTVSILAASVCKLSCDLDKLNERAARFDEDARGSR